MAVSLRLWLGIVQEKSEAERQARERAEREKKERGRAVAEAADRQRRQQMRKDKAAERVAAAAAARGPPPPPPPQIQGQSSPAPAPGGGPPPLRIVPIYPGGTTAPPQAPAAAAAAAATAATATTCTGSATPIWSGGSYSRQPDMSGELHLPTSLRPGVPERYGYLSEGYGGLEGLDFAGSGWGGWDPEVMLPSDSNLMETMAAAGGPGPDPEEEALLAALHEEEARGGGLKKAESWGHMGELEILAKEVMDKLEDPEEGTPGGGCREQEESRPASDGEESNQASPEEADYPEITASAPFSVTQSPGDSGRGLRGLALGRGQVPLGQPTLEGGAPVGDSAPGSGQGESRANLLGASVGGLPLAGMEYGGADMWGMPGLGNMGGGMSVQSAPGPLPATPPDFLLPSDLGLGNLGTGSGASGGGGGSGGGEASLWGTGGLGSGSGPSLFNLPANLDDSPTHADQQGQQSLGLAMYEYTWEPPGMEPPGARHPAEPAPAQPVGHPDSIGAGSSSGGMAARDKKPAKQAGRCGGRASQRGPRPRLMHLRPRNQTPLKAALRL